MAAHAVVKELSDERSVISIDFSRSWCPPLLFTTDEQILRGMLSNDLSFKVASKWTQGDQFGCNCKAMVNCDASDHAQLRVRMYS